MKFERLRLTGFKSFCDAAEFKIEPGLTGVVGPNGCGKSNLVEALRWVMGESSFKAMRASGMDDVIFAGSGKRPSRNNAEVGILLDNADHRAPAAFNEHEQIEVTRRIERESGSTYRDQRSRGARARRPAPVRRRLDRGPLARARPPGADRRDHRRQAAGAAADPRGGGRHFGPALASPRGGAAPQGSGGQSSARRGRAEADRRAGREPEAAGAPVEPLPQSRSRHPQTRGARSSDRLARGRGRLRRGSEEARRRPSRRRRAHPRARARRRACRRSPPPSCRACARRRRAGPPRCSASRSPARRSRPRRSAPASARPNSSAARPSSLATSSASRR